MSKNSLLTNRLLMAQGAIALFEKNIAEALTLSRDCVKVSDIEEGDGKQGGMFPDDDIDSWREELPF